MRTTAISFGTGQLHYCRSMTNFIINPELPLTRKFKGGSLEPEISIWLQSFGISTGADAIHSHILRKGSSDGAGEFPEDSYCPFIVAGSRLYRWWSGVYDRMQSETPSLRLHVHQGRLGSNRKRADKGVDNA